MKRLAQRAVAAWLAFKASREVARQRRIFARSNPHIIAKAHEIEKKRKRHQPTRADTLELRRMTTQALRGGA